MKKFILLGSIVFFVNCLCAQTLDIIGNGNLRSGPGTNNEIIGKVTIGMLVKQIDYSNNWYQIEMPDKKRGWLFKSLVKESSKTFEKASNANFFERIPIEKVDLFDNKNLPKCSLRAVLVSDLPESFEGKVNNMINWPKNYVPPSACPYAESDKVKIVAEGMRYQQMSEYAGFRMIGKFLVDKCLNPISGIWDGKKDGAIHTILGNLSIFDYEFQSDEVSPLVFKITKAGYEYVEGKGVVIDLKTGKKYLLPN